MPSNFKLSHDWEKKIRKAVEPQLRARAQEMERLLADLTRRHKGRPVSQIKVPVRTAFKQHGWELTDPDLTRYATAISEGTKITVTADAGL